MPASTSALGQNKTGRRAASGRRRSTRLFHFLITLIPFGPASRSDGFISPRHLTLSTFVGALLLLLPACDAQRSAKPATSAPTTLHVCVPIVPTGSFAKAVGGEHVEVTVLVPPGASMHTYEPTPRQVAGLANSRIYFELGLPFERKIVAAVRERGTASQVVDLREGVQMRDMQAHEAHAEHSHDAADHHDHSHAAGEKDPHLWLSPRRVMQLAATMAEAFAKADPAHRADYERNLEQFQQQLRKLDAELSEELKPLRGGNVYVFHPTYGYFCDDYGLRQVPIEIAGREPTAKELTELIARAKADKVRAIFVQPQFSRKSAETLAGQVGAAVIVLDPLAEDYFANLREIGQSIRNAALPS